MFGPEDTGQQPADTLQVGPARPPLVQEAATRWPYAVAAGALVLGLAAGAGGMFWWQDKPEPAPANPVRFDEHAVELVLFEALPPRGPRADGRPRPLRISGAFLLSGAVASMVLSIDIPHEGVSVRAESLPVTVSPESRYRAVDLTVRVTDCQEASHWRPIDRPFSITWRDENDRMHRDRAGDFDTSMSTSVVRYLQVACAVRD